MSGFSGGTTCPNCKSECDEYNDWKPFNYSIITCLECGLIISPVIQYMNLRELNERREEIDLPKLRKKPKQETNTW